MTTATDDLSRNLPRLRNLTILAGDLDSLRRRFEKNHTRGDGCWAWNGLVDDTGYGRITVGKRSCRTHRVAYFLYTGKDAEGLLCHRCDNRRCVRPDHLFIGTWADNNHDRDRKGRQVTLRGEDRPKSKLTNDDVRMIRANRYAGKGRKIHGELAELLGVSKALINRVTYHKAWTHIK